jgi:hypothetical protein
MSSDARVYDPLEIAQAGAMLGALEAAVGGESGVVVFWGWLSDPAQELRRLWAEFGGVAFEVHVLERVARPDLLEVYGSALDDRVAELGFLAVTQVDPELLTQQADVLRLVFETEHGAASSANRVHFEAGGRWERSFGPYLSLQTLSPSALAQLGRRVWGPEARLLAAKAHRQARVAAYGPAGEPRLSLVIPWSSDLRYLRETLAYLDMDPQIGGVEVVLVLFGDRTLAEAEAAILGAACEIRIRVVHGGAWTLGAAARIGLETAAADRALLLDESVTPPAAGWINEALNESAAWTAPLTMPRFDGLPARAGLGRLDGPTPLNGPLAQRLRQAEVSAGLAAWSPGLLLGDRTAWLRSGFDWTAMATAEAFWASLLLHAIAEGVAPYAGGDGFTFVPRKGGTELDPLSLMDAHTLLHALEQVRASPTPEALPA